MHGSGASHDSMTEPETDTVTGDVAPAGEGGPLTGPETRYPNGYQEGGGTLNQLYVTSRDSFNSALSQIQATTARVDQIQPTMVDLIARLAYVERLMTGTERGRHSKDVTESKPVNGLSVFQEKNQNHSEIGRRKSQRSWRN